MPAKKAVDIVRQIEETWDSGKLDVLDGFFAPEFQNPSGIPMLPPGLEGSKVAHQMSMQSFPDRKVEILDIFDAGDKVTVRCRMTGTNQGGFPMFGVPANDAKVNIEWIGIYQVKNGKVVQHWAVNDGIALLMQLGAIKPAG